MPHAPPRRELPLPDLPTPAQRPKRKPALRIPRRAAGHKRDPALLHLAGDGGGRGVRARELGVVRAEEEEQVDGVVRAAGRLPRVRLVEEVLERRLLARGAPRGRHVLDRQGEARVGEEVEGAEAGGGGARGGDAVEGAQGGGGGEGGGDIGGGDGLEAVAPDDGLVLDVAEEEGGEGGDEGLPVGEGGLGLQVEGVDVGGGEVVEEEGGGGGVEGGVGGAEVGGEAAEEIGALLVGLGGGQVQRAGLEDAARDGGGGREVGVDVDGAGAFAAEGDLVLVSRVSLVM